MQELIRKKRKCKVEDGDRLSAWLPSSLIGRLRDGAKAKEISISEYVRRLLQGALDAEDQL